MSFEEMYDQLIKDGFITEGGVPIKCYECCSENLEDYQHYYAEGSLVEYSVRCKDCGEHVSTWSYGFWDL
ncbi:zinc ribbon binding domain protein [Bacillus phage 000TH008]|nr:zinc ribbon binding domain protein [Bacillus phage 000TH008]QQO40920.1 zinc ribbon binding domain protein [Bacillus phage 000TH009]QQO41447.1 zinc ribbon domain protein [Bacillus phage 015DV004]